MDEETTTPDIEEVVIDGVPVIKTAVELAETEAPEEGGGEE